MKKGNMNPNAAPGRPQFQGGNASMKEASFKPPKAVPLTKSTGAPKDKGVNR